MMWIQRVNSHVRRFNFQIQTNFHMKTTWAISGCGFHVNITTYICVDGPIQAALLARKPTKSLKMIQSWDNWYMFELSQTIRTRVHWETMNKIV